MSDQDKIDAVPENRECSKPLPEAFVAAQFQPGQSGNPGGRPKSKPITDELNKLLAELTGKGKNQKTLAKAIAQAMVAQARRGNAKVLAELMNRVEGKVADKIEGEVAGKIEVTIHDVSKSRS